MSDQELKEMLAGLHRSQAKTDLQLKETDLQLKETSQQLKETGQQLKETDQLSKETFRQLRELQEQTFQAMRESSESTDRELKYVSRLVGDIGNKFGRFTEGMAEPSMRKLLDGFGMTAIHPRALFRSEDRSRTLEVDVLGYDPNDLREEVYIVEVKSQLAPEDVNQTLKTIADFRELGPIALRHRPIYGVIAAVDIPEGLNKAVIRRGLYLARINDDTFQLLTPPDFKPKVFLHETPPSGKSNGRANGRPKKKKSSKKRSTK